MLKIPKGVVREVMSGNDRGYELTDGTANELEIRIGYYKINDKAEAEEEVLNGSFVVPCQYVKLGGRGQATPHEGVVGNYGSCRVRL